VGKQRMVKMLPRRAYAAPLARSTAGCLLGSHVCIDDNTLHGIRTPWLG
jgi:hypothetical protein